MPTSPSRMISWPDEEHREYNRGKNHLLVIGIDQYEYVGQLQNAARDAQTIRDILLKQYTFESSDLIEFYNEQATRKALIRGLRGIVEKIQADDNLLLYFSGHGHHDKGIDEAYWVPVDATYGEIADYISYSFIMKVIRTVRARHVALIVDSCYAGAVLVRELDQKAERLEKDPSRWLLASGRNEIVSDGIGGKHSPFAEQLIYVLSHPSRSYLRFPELCIKVTDIVMSNATQTPIGRQLFSTGDKGGEYILRLRHPEKEAWIQASDQHSIAAYKAFLESFPDSVKQKDAREAIVQLSAEKEAVAWQACMDTNSLEQYETFIRLYPNSSHLEQAIWTLATLRRTKLGYRQYLQTYPQGRYSKDAIQRMEEIEEQLSFDRAKKQGETGIWKYINTYGPGGRFYKEVIALLDDIKHDIPLQILIESGNEIPAGTSYQINGETWLYQPPNQFRSSIQACELVLSLPDYLPYRRVFSSAELEQTLNGLPLRATLAPRMIQVEVQVKDQHGQFLKQVKITLQNQDSHQIITEVQSDDSGHSSFRLYKPQRNYILTAQKQGYESSQLALNPEDGQEKARLSFRLTQQEKSIPKPSSSFPQFAKNHYIQLHIIDAATKRSIPLAQNSKLVLNGESITPARSEFPFPNLIPDGQLTIELYHQGYEKFKKTFVGLGSQRDLTQPNRFTFNIPLQTAKQGTGGAAAGPNKPSTFKKFLNSRAGLLVMLMMGLFVLAGGGYILYQGVVVPNLVQSTLEKTRQEYRDILNTQTTAIKTTLSSELENTYQDTINLRRSQLDTLYQTIPEKDSSEVLAKYRKDDFMLDWNQQLDSIVDQVVTRRNEQIRRQIDKLIDLKDTVEIYHLLKQFTFSQVKDQASVQLKKFEGEIETQYQEFNKEYKGAIAAYEGRKKDKELKIKKNNIRRDARSLSLLTQRGVTVIESRYEGLKNKQFGFEEEERRRLQKTYQSLFDARNELYHLDSKFGISRNAQAMNRLNDMVTSPIKYGLTKEQAQWIKSKI